MRSRLIAVAVLILAAMPLLAQRVTCTPAVPKKTCQGASELFLEHTGYGGRTPVVISDPSSYKHEKESLLQQMQRRLRLGDSRNVVLFNGYTDDILFVRDDETCPTRVILSTDLFRPIKEPLKTTKGVKGEDVLALPLEYEEGFDRLSALHYSVYVSGFLDGCISGNIAFISDQFAKGRQKN